MNQLAQQSLLHLTDKASFNQVSTEELEQIVSTYPYYAAGHVLLASRYQQEKDSRFGTQLQKAALYAQDPWWLHYHLYISGGENVASVTEAASGITSQQEPATKAEAAPLSQNDNNNKGIVPPEDKERVVLTDGDDNIAPVALLQTDTTLPGIPASIDDIDIEQKPETEESLLVQQPTEGEPAIDVEPSFVATGIEVEEIGALPATDQQDLEGTGDNIVDDKPITQEFSLEEIEESDQLAHDTLAPVTQGDDEVTFTLPAPADVIVSGDVELDQETGENDIPGRADDDNNSTSATLPGETKTIATESQPITTEFSLEEIDASDELAHQVLSEEQTAAEPAGETVTVDRQPQNGYLNGETESEFAPPPLAPEDAERNDQMLKNIQSVLETSGAASQAVDLDTQIPIDPYHTVDYFASQGIKLVLENEPSDKLGKKLKKFTQWLRHMKKIGPEDAIDEEADRNDEATVIKIADFSNTQREVITEAMAQVLEKQGKAEKAVQIYIKLSFLEPDKSAYFADKIKILKGLK